MSSKSNVPILTLTGMRMCWIEWNFFKQNSKCTTILCQESLIVIMSFSRDRSCSQSGSDLAKRALWWGRWRETGRLHPSHQLIGYKCDYPPLNLVSFNRIADEKVTSQISSFADVNLVIYLHGGYWQFLRYSFLPFLGTQKTLWVFILMLCVWKAKRSQASWLFRWLIKV